MPKTEFQRQREIRDSYIVDQFQKLEGDDGTKIEQIAAAIKLTTQRVRDILVDRGAMTRSSYTEAKKNKGVILSALDAADLSDRGNLVKQFAEQYGYNEATIRQWCATAGIKITYRESSTKLALRIVGTYLRVRHLTRTANECGVSREYANNVIGLAETCGLLGLTRGVLKSDPEIAEQLRIIDKANQVINERLAVLAQKGKS